MSLSRRKRTVPARRGTMKGRASNRNSLGTQLKNEDSSAIEQVDIDYERLKSLTRLIQLHNIILMEVSMRSGLDPRSLGDRPVGKRNYTVSLGEARWWLNGTGLDILLEYRVAAFLSREAEQIELFTLTARFAVSYAHPEPANIPTEDKESLMADFVAANGQINVYPYLRQLVADITSRAGWPALVMGVFKAPAKRPRDLISMARVWNAA